MNNSAKSKKTATVPNATNATVKNDDIFEWQKETVECLIFGYVRDNIDSAIPDISSIIYQYLSEMLFDYHINNKKHSIIKYTKNNIICNFKIHNNNIEQSYKYWSTIIFTPYISDMFNNINNINFGICKKEMIISYPKRKKELIEAKIFDSEFRFQCGIICIPKDKKIEIKKLKNIYENTTINDGFGLWSLEECKINPFNIFNNYHVYCTNSSNYFGINKNWNFLGLTTYMPASRIKNDLKKYIKISIECNINKKEYYLSVIKNGEMLGSDRIRNEFIKGKVKLDFVNNDYLFSLSSMQGFEFEVTIPAIL